MVKKTAERLLIEMKDKIEEFSLHSHTIPGRNFTHHNEAIHALESLGYKKQEAIQIIRKIDDGNKSCEQLIREALQALSV